MFVKRFECLTAIIAILSQNWKFWVKRGHFWIEKSMFMFSSCSMLFVYLVPQDENYCTRTFRVFYSTSKRGNIISHVISKLDISRWKLWPKNMIFKAQTKAVKSINVWENYFMYLHIAKLDKCISFKIVLDHRSFFRQRLWSDYRSQKSISPIKLLLYAI